MSAAATIINNCDHLLYLGAQDQRTAEFIGCRAYRTPEAILCKPADKAYLLTSGEKAQLVDKVKLYSTLEPQEKVAGWKISAIENA